MAERKIMQPFLLPYSLDFKPESTIAESVTARKQKRYKKQL
jgi:hypothetical protein